MSMVNDYIMFRLLMEDTDRKSHKRHSLHRNSLLPARNSISEAHGKLRSHVIISLPFIKFY
uniref:Uncharacterized protein n=1 Tax=Heterorhabditis bacteriophora TaxID=37862 RepID=A0A1I7XSX6_HETBA